MELLITALIVGFVIYGLERNNSRQLTSRQLTTHHLSGSTDIQDRDQARLTLDLQARS